MTYVIKTRITRYPDGSYFSSDRLIEMSKRDALKAEASEDPLIEYTIVSGAMAHRYVKQGMIHETPLYIDFDGRVRYARDSQS